MSRFYLSTRCRKNEIPNVKDRTTKVTGFAGRLIKGEGPPLSPIQRASAIFFGICLLATGLAMVVSGITEVWQAGSIVSVIAVVFI